MTVTGLYRNITYQNADDWGMVQMAGVLPTKFPLLLWSPWGWDGLAVKLMDFGTARHHFSNCGNSVFFPGHRKESQGDPLWIARNNWFCGKCGFESGKLEFSRFRYLSLQTFPQTNPLKSSLHILMGGWTKVTTLDRRVVLMLGLSIGIALISIDFRCFWRPKTSKFHMEIHGNPSHRWSLWCVGTQWS